MRNSGMVKVVDLLLFRWLRPRKGSLRWERRRPAESGSWPEGLWLTPAAPDSDTKPYDPLMTEPTLFRRFADLWPTDEKAILAFAEIFGVLGVSAMSLVDNGSIERVEPAEPLGLWTREIRAMRHAVDLLDAIQKKNRDRLKKWVYIAEDHTAALYFREDIIGSTRTLIADAKSPKALRTLVEHDAISDLARLVLQNEFINVRLREHGSLQVVYSFDTHGDKQSLRGVPANLLGAMWLQVGQALDRNIRYRRCKWRPCDKWIEITGTFAGHTKAREFCSDKHRVYYHRKTNPAPRKGPRK
jgi:hypothetical protein